ncbi:hypothetical protein M6D93_13585 [Jatrophihabitans telluris]|uniref:LPXTG cell wall anchor domain-containing protein n=1 Tax=Jatrophihabitans telluris TaxID=2038343 RepID=A0ABY4QV38_9ACTN|nr:hypothetical protein [Jatrophihabitans telluris]UQX87325.1 hypothetical protein M6D93_13585 [Jatrophihabitans telluris]
MTDQSTNGDTPQSAASRLFDIRLLIGGLFTVYGVMLTVAGLFTSDAQRKKASDININLWLGLGMLLLGLLFLLWMRLNPLRVEPKPTDSDSGPAVGETDVTR